MSKQTSHKNVKKLADPIEKIPQQTKSLKEEKMKHVNFCSRNHQINPYPPRQKQGQNEY